MELKTTQQLKSEFDLISSSDNLAFIRFYESNIQSIDSIDSSLDDDHYNFKLRLICEYGISLVSGGQYTKGVSVLEKAIPMFENEPKNSNFDLKTNSYLEHLLWNYGLALWEVKRTNESMNVFRRLVSYYPENDKYRNWLAGLKASKLRKIATPIWLCCFIWLLGDLLFFDKLDPQTRLYLSVLGLLILLSAGLMELIILLIKKNKSTKA